MTEVIDLLKSSFENASRTINTCFPGKVLRYDPQKRLVDVKPLLSRRLEDGREVELPVINNVPLVWPGTGNSILCMDMKQGDTVLILCCDRSIDEWISLGGTVTPKDRRHHSLSDGVAIPGLFYTGHDNGAEANKLKLQFNTSKVEIESNGDIKINSDTGKIALGNSSEELLQLFSELLTALINAYTITLIGNQPLSEVATFTSLLTRLNIIKGTL